MAEFNEDSVQTLLLSRETELDLSWPAGGEDGQNGGWVAAVEDGSVGFGGGCDHWSAQAGAAENEAEWIDQLLNGPDDVEGLVFISPEDE